MRGGEGACSGRGEEDVVGAEPVEEPEVVARALPVDASHGHSAKSGDGGEGVVRHVGEWVVVQVDSEKTLDIL